jgi:hypothetical protein
LRVLQPAELALPTALLGKIPPRPSGFGATRELFPRNTGLMFDAVTPAVLSAGQVVSGMLSADRAARLVEQSALDPALPGLEEVIDSLFAAAFNRPAASAYEAELQRTVQRIVVDELINLAGAAVMPQVRAIASFKLRARAALLFTPQPAAAALTVASQRSTAHAAMLAEDITRFMNRPVAAVAASSFGPTAPPGAPIGEPAMDWLRWMEPPCTHYYQFDRFDF